MPVPHDQNAQLITVDVALSNGETLAQLPVPGTEVISNNANVQAGIFNAGTRQVYAKRLVPGPIAADITTVVNGVPSPAVLVQFDGAPAPTVVSVTQHLTSTGNL